MSSSLESRDSEEGSGFRPLLSSLSLPSNSKAGFRKKKGIFYTIGVHICRLGIP